MYIVQYFDVCFTLFQADLGCLTELVFVGNPLEEEKSGEGIDVYRTFVANKLTKLKKLDGMYYMNKVILKQ